MSTTILTPNQFAAEGADNQRKLDALCRLVTRGQGRFVLALVEFDLPSLRTQVFDGLKAGTGNLNLVRVELWPPPPDTPHTRTVLDQLEELAELYSPGKAPDALIITGYETLLADDLRRAVQPLNLGRNDFVEAFPCPVLLCLPPAAMGVFLRSAPDLASLRSGYFKFKADLPAVRAELKQEAKKPINWLTRLQMRRYEPEKLFNETKRLAGLIADSEAIPVGSLLNADRLIAQLYNRLGWMAVAFKNRRQARDAFGKMLKRAQAADDRKLIAAAERGQRAAEATVSAPRLSPKQTDAPRSVFIGAAALTEDSGLYGREEELRELISRTTHVATRFLTVWGESGSGKSSLVLAGLLPELKRQGHYLPVVVRQWHEQGYSTGSGSDLAASQRPASGSTESPPLPALNRIRPALEQASGLSLDSFNTLRDCIAHVAQQTQKTVVIICDQFEQFFTSHPQRSQRSPLLNAIGVCVNDPSISCKFIFIVREDHLGRVVEFEMGDEKSRIPESLREDKRLYLPLFNATDAIRVLRQQANKAAMDWPEEFIRAVVRDLTHEDRVRPVEFQLAGAALAISGISSELSYKRGGRLQGLFENYLEQVLKHLAQSGLSVDLMKRVLSSLVSFDGHRIALTSEKIEKKLGIGCEALRWVLSELVRTHLIQVAEATSLLEPDKVPVKLYELVHDELVGLVLAQNRDLREQQKQATRLLDVALEETQRDPRHMIGLENRTFILKNVDKERLASPDVAKLLWRSLRRRVFRYTAICSLLLLAAVGVWFGFANPVERGNALFAIGMTETSLGFFLEALASKDDPERPEAINEGRLSRSEAIKGLKKVTLRNPGLSSQTLPYLMDALEGGDANLRLSADVALTEIDKAASNLPELSGELQQSLLARLALPTSDKNFSSSMKIIESARANPKKWLPLLLESLKDNKFTKRRTMIDALEQVAQADHGLAPEVFDSLLAALTKRLLKNDQYQAANVLVKIAQIDEGKSIGAERSKAALQLLTNQNSFVRDGAQQALANHLFDLAKKERESKRDSEQFLFSYLEGNKSLIHGNDESTQAANRQVAVLAMARWLNWETGFNQLDLQQKFKEMCDQNKDPLLRSIARDVLDEFGKRAAVRGQSAGTSSLFDSRFPRN